ncbi:PREDICTED: DBF4-type zinc finger-containing protein 2, partial [Nanorana parkeri]|uniref:DBF4-type zinc finger-containing protein 2 n=1 Tax=Nanorana parkeri TaxID=125878 RepID=UPI0008549EFB
SVKLDGNNRGNGQVQEQLGSSLHAGYYRQGYCSCCQVHYINLEKHLASDQHRRVSKLHKNQLSKNTLMERFLQDVHLYHPQNYHDTRPTYDDIPEVNVLTSSHEERTCTLSQETQAAVSSCGKITDWDKHCVSESYRSRINCKETTFTQSRNTNPEEAQCSKTGYHQQSIFSSPLTTCQKALCKTVNTIPQTFHYSTLPLYPTSQMTANNSFLETQHSVHCSGSSNNRETNYGKCKKCPGTAKLKNPTNDLQNRQFNFQGSYHHLTSGTLFKNERIFKSQENKECILRDHELYDDSNKLKNDGKCKGFSHFKNKGLYLSKDDGNLVDEIIEAVIKKYCHESSSDKTAEKDEESVLSLNVPSITEGSTLSFDLNAPTELKEDHLKITMTNLDLHKQSDVNIDEEYNSKLKCILRESPPKEIQAIKHEHEEDVLPALPHIPPSFVGKTWSQVMYEDDLKIEALVKEFRKGKFHCYFEDDCSVNVGSKRKHNSRQIEKKVEVKTEDLDESQKMNLLPLFEDFCEDQYPDTNSMKSERLLKSKPAKPCKRVWRQASRCQVVKVSHGTQTSLVNYPVVKKKVLKSESQGVFDYLEEERTPDMKTRMCALKLPESYNKILTPLQPKTMVYVLSHPDIKPSTCRRSRNRCSTDSRDSVYFKYKQSPLKYYDPLTNRILKTPPRNSVRGMSSKALCVRKLFRSLSSEGNVDKVNPESKESSTSKKSLSSCSVASLHFGSVKGKDLSSSIKGSGSSVNSECIGSGYVKSGHSEKPYTHITISPCKAANTKAKEDTQNSILLSKSKSKPIKQQKLITREHHNSSARHSKSRIESLDAARSKHNPQRMVKNLGKQTQGKSKCRKQPRKKSSSVLPKSNKSFARARHPNKEKVTNQRDAITVQDHKKRLVKSEFVSLNPKKRKQMMTKNSFQNAYQDKHITRSRSKTSELIVQNTMHYLRSRHAVANIASNTRTFTNKLTRRKVR